MNGEQPPRVALLAWRIFLISLLVLAAVGLWSAGRITQAGRGPAWLRMLFAPEPAPVHIGLVAGHRGNDSGTVCQDGLTEAEINLKIAELVADALRRQDMEVDLLDEFDPRLRGYTANALVSIHADSCSVDLSGFKVTGPVDGGEASDRLAACLWKQYSEQTGLPGSPDTITEDMLRYHAFREIALTTPGAIIETGFLGGDRAFLTQHADLAAAGIVQGVICFLAQK